MPCNVRRSLVTAVALVCAAQAHGAGIALSEVSARGLGTAFAATGAAADGASSQWFNPASMTVMEDSLAITLSRVAPSFEFEDQGSFQRVGTTTLPLLPQVPASAKAGESSLVPTLFYVHAPSERWRVGLGLNAPFGLSTDYDDDWRGRYHAVESEITSINVNPSAAYRVSDHWSLGVGVSINYVEARLTNAVDFAAVCSAAAGGACPNGAVPGQGQFDGFVENDADGTAVGFNFGLLWHDDRTRLGVSYRSELDHDLEGSMEYRLPETLGGFEALGPELGAALASRFRDADITAPLTLPDSVHVSAFHRLGRLSLTANVAWYDWGDIPQVSIIPEGPAAEPVVEPLDWQSSVRTAVGAMLDVGQRWTLRAGAAYDESPIPDAQARTPRLPGNDRTWLAVGASYRISDNWSVDAGYAHLFLDDSSIDRIGRTGDQLIGEYQASADIVALELSGTL